MSPRLSSTSLTVVLATLLVLALLAPLGATAGAAPPPEDVCGACEAHFETAVEDAGGPSVTVGESRLDVHLAENGSAKFVAQNTLQPADAAWVANNTDAVAHALATTDAGLDESKHALSVRLVGDTAVVEYVDDSFGYQTIAGVVVADAFTRTQTGWEVNTGRFVVHAPGTYVVASHDRGDTTVGWDDSVDAEPVAFAPTHGPVSAAATRFALVAETGPAFLRGAAFVLVPFVVVLSLLFRGVDTAVEVTPSVDARTAGGAAVAAGGAVALALVATGAVSLYFMLPGAVLLFTAVTAVAVGAAALREPPTTLSLGLAAVGVPLSVGVVAAFVGALAYPGVFGWTVGRALSAGCLAAQVGVFAVLGATRNRDGGRRWRRFTAAVAPVVGVVALLGPTVVLLAWVPLLAVLAPLAYLLGASVGRSGLRSV
ncbi:hypothetical protein [Halobacterium wangiae]|uniref:hypothetical protein n=1 Tax=Halobacterium wangiae TaxID=2902623 RepID=UPI001E5D9DC5|nr:hypothetical protein [Halobacterium wangiae]